MYTYEKCYKILLIEPECNRDNLRKAYKKLIQKWHPDRFTDEVQKLSAEDKIKELNIAYFQLSDYYKKHNSLPFISKPEVIHRTKRASVSKPQAPDDSIASTSEDPSASKTTKNSSSDEYSNKIYLTLVVIISLFVFINSDPDNESTHSNTLMNNAYKTDSADGSIEIKAIETHEIGKSDITQEGVSGSKDISEINAIPNTQPADYFTYGSSIGEVLSIQGRPDSIDGDYWFYGNSYVKFKDGVVEDWKRSSEFPLKAHIDI
jgi:curved DNA-binding protein CbpA